MREFFPAPFVAGVAAYSGVIFYLSSLPQVPVPFHFPYLDKIAHFFLFGGLAVTVIVGLRRAVHEYSAVARGAIPVAICFLYGVSDEIHQLFVENRMFDPTDVAADVMGAAVATGLLSILFRIKDSRG